jgi:hypothetical protein
LFSLLLVLLLVVVAEKEDIVKGREGIVDSQRAG